MHSLRALIRDHRHLAMLLIALALCIRAMIPAGYMIATAPDTVLTVAVCADASGEARTMKIAVPGKAGHAGEAGQDAKKHSACAFASHAKAAAGGADPVLLALAFAFILAIGLARVTRPPFRRILGLRPPLRGPPLPA